MTDKAWSDHFARCLGVLLNGNTLDETDEYGEPIEADTLFLMFNAHHGRVIFRLPGKQPTERWERLLDTADPKARAVLMRRDITYKLEGRSVVVLRLRSAGAYTIGIERAI